MTAPTKTELIQALINQGLFYVCDLPGFVKVRRKDQGSEVKV